MRWTFGAALAAAALLLNLVAARAQTPAPCAANDPTNVDTGGHVAVCGALVSDGAVFAYEGIPYATALRWTAPVAVPFGSGPAVQRIAFGPICPQAHPYPGYAVSEDCLSLNVWKPGSATEHSKLPVMVFIHGGAFVSGAGSLPVYDGTAFATQNVIVVTLNYRLGALGFLVARNTLHSGRVGGNFGIMDQQLAMQWVKDNIAAFGGDPDKITLFGESAGAMSVGLHTFSMPSSGPLFRAAIMESNPASISYDVDPLSDKTCKRLGSTCHGGEKFLHTLCKVFAKDNKKSARTCRSDAGWLSKVTTTEVIEAQSGETPAAPAVKLGRAAPAKAAAPKGNVQATSAFQGILANILNFQNLPWQPVVDGALIRGEPYDGYAKDVTAYKPIAFGTNADEGTLFISAIYHTKLKWIFNRPLYEAAMYALFGRAGGDILKNPRYTAKNKFKGTYFNNVAWAFSNLATDYVFSCGTLSAINHAHEAAPAQALYGYHFTQDPFTDMYALQAGNKDPLDHGACEPATGNVCHGNELPYAFDTLASVTRPPEYTPKPGDKDIAKAMNAAWLAFAVDPDHPGVAWRAYDTDPKSANHVVTQWNAKQSAPIDLDQAASCKAIWLNAAPFKP